MTKPPPGMSEEEESPGVEEEERCGRPPMSPPSRPMKHPLGTREEERCDGGYRRLELPTSCKSLVAISDLPLHELQMIANHDCPN
jgi:hypothetical protein